MNSDQHMQSVDPRYSTVQEGLGWTVWDAQANGPAELGAISQTGLTIQEANKVVRRLGMMWQGRELHVTGTDDCQTSVAKSPSKRAEARLIHLMHEGIVTGVGVARVENQEQLFIGISVQTDVKAPDYEQSTIDAIRCRLKDALGETPFQILGEDEVGASESGDDSRREEASMPKVAALEDPFEAKMPQNLDGSGAFAIPIHSDRQGQNLGSPAEFLHHDDTSGAGASSDVSERLIRLEEKLDASLRISNLNASSLSAHIRASDDRLIRLEAIVAGLPSKGFVVTATAVVLAFAAPVLVLQSKLPGLVKTAFIAMR